MSTVTLAGVTLKGVHPKSECKGRHCVIHNPKSTHMDSWPQVFRLDRFLFERICPCGVGHPDESQFDYWEATGRMVEAVHGCCGCCHLNPDYRPRRARFVSPPPRVDRGN